MLGTRGLRFNRTSWFAGVCTVAGLMKGSAAPMAPHGTRLAADWQPRSMPTRPARYVNNSCLR